MLLLPQNKYTPLHHAVTTDSDTLRYTNKFKAVQLLLTAKANPDAADRVSDSPRSVMELCRVLSCVVDWGRSTSEPRYTMLLGMGTVSQCSYYSLRRQMLLLRLWSVTRPL